MADEYFEPFRLACETQNKEIVEIALMAITTLVSGGYLTGELTLQISNNKSNGSENSPSDDNNPSTPIENNNDKSENNSEYLTHKSSNSKQTKYSKKRHSRQPKLIDIIIKTVCDCTNIISLHLSVM